MIEFIERIGWRTSALAASLSVIMFILFDQLAQTTMKNGEYGHSGALSVVATFFLICSVICGVITVYQMWTEPEDRI